MNNYEYCVAYADEHLPVAGHCGVPFALIPQRFVAAGQLCSPDATGRIWTPQEEQAPRQWARDFCQWLDDWTYYRKHEEIVETFARHLTDFNHIEADWFQRRFGYADWPDWLCSFIARKLGHMTIEARKPPA